MESIVTAYNVTGRGECSVGVERENLFLEKYIAFVRYELLLFFNDHDVFYSNK